MATPTLQDVLGAVPAVATTIDEMTELIPGVPSNKQNLVKLLEYLMKDKGVTLMGDRTKPHILIEAGLELDSDGEEEEQRMTINMQLNDSWVDGERVLLDHWRFSCCIYGLAKAISTGKHALKRFRDEGPCNGCGTPKRKKLKLEGMPYCGRCMFEKALGV